MLDAEMLPAALDALADEVEAVAAFDSARDAVVGLIAVGANPDAIYQALRKVDRCRARCGQCYYALEAILIDAGWSMEDDLPAALREALDEQIPAQEQHLARTAQADRILAIWFAEEDRRHAAQRYHQARCHRERAHTKRAHRRRGGGV